MLKKIIFLFAWLGIFVLSIAGINYILLPGKFIFESNILSKLTEFEMKMGILAICVVYLLVCICKFFSLFERKKDYEQVTENGIVKISNATINNYIIELLRRDSEIANVKVNSQRKGKNFYTNIKFEILVQLNVADKISQIQALVKESLKNNIGIDVKEVIVNVSGLSTKENNSYSNSEVEVE